MKFPRNARMLRGHLDAAPFAGVFFCLLIMILLASLVYTPGVIINLPAADPQNLTGVEGPVVAVAVSARGQIYFQSELITRQQLPKRLKDAVAASSVPMTLQILADALVSVQEQDDIINMGRTAGFKQVKLAVRPLYDAGHPKGP